MHIGGRQSSRPDTSPWLDHGLSLCSAPRHGVRASSNRPGAASFGCKTCHCARRRPFMSHWTSEAAAADLSSLCARRVPTLALDRAKSQPKPGSVNQPAGWTATSTARPAEVWKGARDALDCEEQQQRGAERKRQPHWSERRGNGHPDRRGKQLVLSERPCLPRHRQPSPDHGARAAVG